jgi:UV DNA damage endonuclease
MKIGYPCINNSIPRNAPSTFRLASYSENRLIQTLKTNLMHLDQILRYNVKNNFLFFRISSDLVPFASHPICKLNWHRTFQSEFEEIGNFINKRNIRVSMHPDQFVILNSSNTKIVENSINELKYHCNILDAMCLDETAKVQIHVGDAMCLDETAKVQIHVGGVYKNKQEAIDRFVRIFNGISKFVDGSIKKRLVIENDDRLYSLMDCLSINQETGIPIVFDVFHHELLNNNEPLRVALQKAMSTWKMSYDGFPIVDYSSQNKVNRGENKVRRGRHTETIDLTLFKRFLKETQDLNFDIMLEIKDKEKSALKALELLRTNKYFVPIDCER